MQYITPKKNNNISKKKTIAIILIIISSIGYFSLFSGFLGFIKNFLLGFFGLFSYPLFFAGYAISFMLLKNKKFIIFTSLALFSILCIFHMAFLGGIINTSFGAHLSDVYFSKLSVGGILISLLTYPITLLLQNFGAYILFTILLIISAYKIIDFFLVNKNSKNFVTTNKKQKTRIEEIRVSQNASDFLNNQLFNEETENDFQIAANQEEKVETKRDIARSKLGLGEIRNQPVVSKNLQLETFEKAYSTNAQEPIFFDNNEENVEDKNEVEIKNFNPFNNATFNKKSTSVEDRSKKERNLDFLRATLDSNYHKNTTEEIASQKKRNLNLEDNLKNLPINNYIKENDTKLEQNNQHTIDQELSNNQNNNLNSNETTKNNGNKISDVKIDDLLNKVKKLESQNIEEPKKYAQTNLLENKKEPKMATYTKPIKYVRPTTNLLTSISTNINSYCDDYEEKAAQIERTLENFRVPAKVIGVTCGPAVTRFELEMPPGISVSKINQYSDDIAYALASSHGVRIEAPIPGKSAVGIEVPNKEIATIGLREVLESKEFYSSKGKLIFALGKDINGNFRVCNMEKMPHLLIAGSTGSGKSVCLNVLLISLLYKCSPEELRIVLVDPKRVEFSMFNNLPHLLIPEVISSSDKAINALNYLIKEMERRYELFEELYVKKLEEYNLTQEVVSGQREKLPSIIMIIDEMNDLMSSNKKEIEDRVVRIAQKARAAGIHLILATQRPSVDVITGTIKSNLPSRIAFAVTSNIDSRTILDKVGAEKLLGKGDMLYYPQDLPEPSRIQCAFVSNEEVKAVVDFIKQNNESIFSDEAQREINKTGGENHSGSMNGYDPNEVDSLMQDALKFVIEIGQASISKLQRHFGLGFSRAGKIIDQMERLHYISPADGSKPRTVYLTMDEYREIYGED